MSRRILKKGGFSFQIVSDNIIIKLLLLFDFNNSDSSNTEDADRINRKGDEKKQKGLPSESLSSTDSQNTASSEKNTDDSGREMGTGDLHHKETSLCTGR